LSSTLLGELLDLGRLVDQAEPVAQPLDERARHRDRSLEHVGRVGIADLVAHAREQLLGPVDLVAGVHQQEGAGAVGVLRIVRLEAGLAEQGGVLVTEDAGNGAASDGGALDLAVLLAGGADLREHRARHAHQLEARLVPVERLEVPHQGARRVGHVRHVQAAVPAAGQVPEHPGVHRPEGQLAVLGALSRAVHVVEDPGDLRSREVGGERQAGLVAQAVEAFVAGGFAHERAGAGVLPDDRVVDGLAALAVPDHGGLALVGDTDRHQVADLEPAAVECPSHHCDNIPQDLLGVVLHPARARKDLLVFLLAEGDDPTLLIEYQAA